LLSCGPTQNEKKVQKNILCTVFELSVFGSARVGLGPTRYELGPATWDLTCDLGGGT